LHGRNPFHYAAGEAPVELSAAAILLPVQPRRRLENCSTAGASALKYFTAWRCSLALLRLPDVDYGKRRSDFPYRELYCGQRQRTA
jgi:hypothetical protein